MALTLEQELQILEASLKSYTRKAQPARIKDDRTWCSSCEKGVAHKLQFCTRRRFVPARAEEQMPVAIRVEGQDIDWRDGVPVGDFVGAQLLDREDLERAERTRRRLRGE